MNGKLFYIDSRKRTSGTDSDFFITLDIPVDNKYNAITCLQASIPKSYFLIDTPNNTFELVELGVPTTITLTPGNVNRRSFASILGTLLTSNSPNGWTYIITYPNASSQVDDGRYTFTVSGNSGNQPEFIFTNGLWEQTGFNKNSTNVFVGDELKSVNTIKLVREDTLFIRSDKIDNSGNDILTPVFTSSNPDYSSIVYNNFEPSYNYRIMNTAVSGSTTFNFRLTNEDGDVINLQGINMLLVVYIFKKDMNRTNRGLILRNLINGILDDEA
jgi:hypothetical protein